MWELRWQSNAHNYGNWQTELQCVPQTVRNSTKTWKGLFEVGYKGDRGAAAAAAAAAISTVVALLLASFWNLIKVYTSKQMTVGSRQHC